MKFVVQLTVVTGLLALVIYAAVAMGGGVVPDNPWASVGLGLIGLGLIRHRQQAAARRG